MNYIEYIEEEVKEEIFEGTYILDGLTLTEEQQREKIFNLMRIAGVEVGDESLLEIGYEGAEDDYGVSETQSTKFIVTRKTTKKVPYKVTKEEVFEGTFILDGFRLTEEQQREKIFNLMKRAGVEITKEEFDTYEIGYEGAEDDYGISETQSTKFVVYKTTRVKLDENEVVETNDLEQVLNEIKILRDKLNSIVNDVSKTDIIQELVDKTSGLEKMISNNEKANSNIYTEAIKEIDEELLLIEKKLKEAIKLYEESYEKMRSLLEEQNEKLNNSGLLTDEEYNQIMEEFLGKRIEENENTIAIKKEIEARKKQIAALKRRKNKIKKDLASSEALGIPASQYQNITNTLMKRKLVNAIFEAKGLEEILAIPSKERTKEQQKKLKDAKEEIIEEIAKLQKSHENGISVLDAIEALYGIDAEMLMKGKAKEYKLTKKEFENLKDNVALLPEKIVVKDKKLISNNVLNSINPVAAPEDMIEVYDKKVQEDVKNEDKEVIEEVNNEIPVEVVEEVNNEIPVEVVEETKPVEMITLFIDDENLEVYARKYVFDRFHLEKQSDEILIDETVCFKMDEEDADWIIENKDNNYSPYLIDTRQVKIDKIKEDNKIEYNKPIEKVTIYIDEDNNNEVYGSRYLFGRFNMDMLSDEVRIDGKTCFRMSEEDAAFILDNQDNSYSPYVVEKRKIQLGKREKQNHILVDKPIEKMTLYIDSDNNNEVYGNRYLFNRFNLKTLSDGIRIDGKICFRMDENDADYILGNQNNNYSPYAVEIREVQLGKKVVPINDGIDNIVIDDTPEIEEPVNTDNGRNEPDNTEIGDNEKNDDDDVIITPPVVIEPGNEKEPEGKEPEGKEPFISEPEDDDVKKYTVRPHVEEILDKLTSGLDIGPKDCPRYMSSNIRVAQNFARELHTGNVAYNIVHFVPNILNANVGLFKKISAKLLLSSRGKHSMTELQDRLEELTEEELEVLFEEYKGSQLKTDMNNQINPIILDRLRRYGLEKVAVINSHIKENYGNLFVLLGQIKAIEEKLNSNKVNENEVIALNAERDKLMQLAAKYVIDIKDERKKANDILSGGIHGLEEDFKAVATKLSYVGFRFAKTNAFNNELQHKLGQFGQGLNIAIANNDYEGIVNNFMSLESLYFENTDIKGNALTRRSVGSKYYTPLAEQFDYRDDPFVRDLLSTVAITSATVSAINAIRVHQIESAQINSNIDAANAHNQATMDQVHQIGNDISGKADDFRTGMEAQAQGDVLGASNTIERAELDMHNWSFTDAYRAADKTGHNFYNQFSDDVTSKINDVANRYSSGAITQDVALKEMAAIANSSHQTLVNVSDQCLSILRNYASSHSNFDLSAVEDAMSYLIAHPDAVANMNNGMVDVVNLGESLKGLTTQQYQSLVSIPSDMLSTLICACSAASLAGYVSSNMDHRYNGKVEYGNEVVDMMDEYYDAYFADEDEDYVSRRRKR